ncbi:MAG: hypothetical protein H7Y01_07225 [Ferruginibacter sp.]|nr:hypothetical protein [Chitinophagaceae bacterium]
MGETLKRYLLLVISVLSLAFCNCGSQKLAAKNNELNSNYKTRRMLLRDEGLSQLSYLDLANPAANWYLPVPPGRDLQLTGRGRVLIGTGTGYEEREISTGKKVVELTSFPGTIAARRLRNGNTLLTGANWQGKKGIVLVEIDASGTIQRLINYPAYDYVRLVRETAAGNFLVTADNIVFEGNSAGAIVWQVKVTGKDKPHAWQALRLANGKTIVSTGYAKNFQIFSANGKLVDSISGPAEVKPEFYAGFQILGNGNYVVTNWQGHGVKFGATGTQLLEYTPAGRLAWSWQQDPTRFSSLQGVVVLDGLDIQSLHVEDDNGKLATVLGK